MVTAAIAHPDIPQQLTAHRLVSTALAVDSRDNCSALVARLS